MEVSTQGIVAVALLAAFLVDVGDSSVIPMKENWRNDESWAEEYNLVEPPPPGQLFMKFFDSPKSKSPSQASLKTIIKALYQLDAMKERSDESDSKSTEVEAATDNPSTTVEDERHNDVTSSPETTEGESTVPTPSLELLPPKEDDSSESSENSSAPSSENEEQTTHKLGILLEDLVDSIVHLPPHMEADRTDKFTHSIRYGYGTPFHPKGL